MTADDYQAFLTEKRKTVRPLGPEIDPGTVHERLFPFQRDLVRWSVHKGRAAIFADTGLGKTLMQLEWARLIGGRVLIAAPLAVAQQTTREASTLGMELAYATTQDDAGDLAITNYERLDAFDPAKWDAVVLDESSILKSYDGKTRTKLIGMFADTPYRLCCTATPAPNDIAEIANHAEFLGILTRAEMLATYFVHDDSGWRLKGHARDPFFRWLASWGMTLKRPSDLGYEDDGFALPPLRVHEHWTESDWQPDGQLFSTGLGGITNRTQVRAASVEDRVEQTAELIANTQRPWVAWVGRNDEGRLLAKVLGDEAVLVEGSQKAEDKEERLLAFLSGESRVLVTKASIAGFGLNMQHCSDMAFVGLSDSFESYYQAVRRCWRFGQSRPVNVHIVLSHPERPILENVLAKEQEAESMSEDLTRHVAQFERAELEGDGEDGFVYAKDEATGTDWRLLLGDSTERLSEIDDGSIDLSVFSPPFLSLYTYTATERDLGNSATDEEFWVHFDYIIRELLRVVKPGRNVAVHVAQVPTTLAHHGVIGLKDLRGKTIEHFQEAGFVYHGEVCIDKDPQAQAIRTHAKGLLFVQKSRDASWLRPGLADYILVFRSPGENAVPVIADVTNEEWIEWARPVWYGIRESETLNVREARSEKDERHIAPLQLETIRRCIKLWTNPRETVLSPFAGIGSEGYQALLEDRKYVGIELKPEYFQTATTNLRRAEAKKQEAVLFA